MKTIARHWPIAAALLLFLTLQVVLGRAALRAADDHLVYPLDDTYIQMAIGKHVAMHGVWGLTRHEFSGAGSSLLWPFLLASADRVVGVDVRTPFVLNLAAACALLGLAYTVLRRYVPSRAGQAGALALLILAAPLMVLTVIGMEHTLQVVFTLAVAASGARLGAASSDAERRRVLRWTLLAATATVAVRVRRGGRTGDGGPRRGGHSRLALRCGDRAVRRRAGGDCMRSSPGCTVGRCCRRPCC